MAWLSDWEKRIEITLDHTTIIGTWTRKTPILGGARWGSASAVYGRKIYVFGGHAGAKVSRCDCYDPATDSWTNKTSIPNIGDFSGSENQGLMAVTVGNHIYLFYGVTVLQFDPNGAGGAGSYLQKADAPVSRKWACSAYVSVSGEDRIYIIGGYNIGTSLSTNLNYYYRPTNNTWSAAQTAAPYTAHGILRDNPVINGLIYWGFGLDTATSTFYKSLYSYNPSNDTWSAALASATYERDGLGCGVIGGKLYAVGGRNAAIANPYGLPYCEEYDPTGNTWTTKIGMYIPLADLPASVVSDKLYTFGGYALGSATQRATVQEYDPDGTETLTNFPILFYISSSSGKNAQDITAIFDEVGANSHKIAITTSDGQTQCYVEIEEWDNAGEKAWLWVKIPSVSNSANTILYIYFDNNKPNNDTYIGDLASAVAQNVWDEYYVMVQHLRGANKSELDDSTSKNNDVSGSAGNPSYNQQAKISKGVDLESNTNDYLTVSDANTLDLLSEWTLEGWIKLESWITGGVVEKYDWQAGKGGYVLRTISTNKLRIMTIQGLALDSADYELPTPFALATWAYCAGTFKNSIDTLRAIVNDLVGGSNEAATLVPTAGDGTLKIGRSGDASSLNFDGLLDELRISNIVRSNNWLIMSYHTGKDSVLTFGTLEYYSFTLTITCNSNVTITVEGVEKTTPYSEDFPYNTVVDVVFIEDEPFNGIGYDYWKHYYFKEWNDGVTEKSRQIIMNEDKTLDITIEEKYVTPYTEYIKENSVITITMPEIHSENGKPWLKWQEDGDTNRTKTFTLNEDMILTGIFGVFVGGIGIRYYDIFEAIPVSVSSIIKPQEKITLIRFHTFSNKTEVLVKLRLKNVGKIELKATKLTLNHSIFQLNIIMKTDFNTIYEYLQKMKFKRAERRKSLKTIIEALDKVDKLD